ncbi:formylglycine-generating enzyme family protein [Candidatus Methylomirabilis sp.]|uniref:formylglycine-generating enzyme family protein n=1 Tax=Candidatus Methylomirabilis sp. TaxID=2032687 RepID=UPI002A5E1894|nr:formylglycine-generating enzyme family protein [Candidatus Methylomirabilis sp.]
MKLTVLMAIMIPVFTFALQNAAATPPAQDDVEMVAVPAGEFIMGSDDPEADDNEKPATKVYVRPFSIDKFEATNARYLRCIEAGACTRPIPLGYDATTRANLPVTVVSWQQAVAYCRWVGKRLPTEAEWERAARGTDGRRYPWGNTFEAERANVGYSVGSATPVGSYPKGASPYGVMDMAGNVWEWTSSLYKPYPYDPHDGREDPNARGSRVERGGGWYTPEWHARTTRRTAAGHVYRRFSDLGFRCAK